MTKLKFNTKLFSLLVSLVCLMSFIGYKPTLFVIGDSISIFYGPYLEKNVQQLFSYDRKRDKGEAMVNPDKPTGANGGDSRMVVDYLRELSADKTFHADFLLINCGLHDIKTNPLTGEKQISLDEYRKNLETIYQLTKKMKTTLIWVNCTPVNDSIHNSKGVSFFRYNRDVLAYNHLSDSVFRSVGVKIIDLYAFSAGFPADAYMDHVHYKSAYVQLQAAFIAGFLHNIQK